MRKVASNIWLQGKKAGFASGEVKQEVIFDGNMQTFQLKGDMDPIENTEAPVALKQVN